MSRTSLCTICMTRIPRLLEWMLTCTSFYTSGICSPGVRTQHSEKIDGRDAYVSFGVEVSQPSAKFYSDKGPRAVGRIVRYAEPPVGMDPSKVDSAVRLAGSRCRLGSRSLNQEAIRRFRFSMFMFYRALRHDYLSESMRVSCSSIKTNSCCIHPVTRLYKR